MMQLKNKVAIVTGASSGIGYAAAKCFAAAGALLVVGARREALLDQLVADIVEAGGTAVPLVGNVKEETYAEQLVNVAIDRFGRLDVAFNNAGTNDAFGIDSCDLSHAEWQHSIDTNLTSAFFAAKYQVPCMRKQGHGSIIFTSSFVGNTTGFPKNSAYAAGKAGVVGLTKALAAEYGEEGVRVNALLPGGTDTPMGRAFATTPEMLEFVQQSHALKRLATPGEIARAALFLASEDSSFVTGSAMFVDGGISITKV